MKYTFKAGLTALMITLLFVGTGTENLKAQDLTSDLLRLNQTYECLDQLAMDIDFRIYASHSSQVLVQQARGKSFRKGGQHFQELMGNRVYRTPDYMLMVNDQRRVLLLDDGDAGAKQDFAVDFVEELMTLADAKSSPIAGTDGQRGHSITSETAEFARIDIVFEAESFLLRKLVVYYRRSMPAGENGTLIQPRLEISFGNLRSGKNAVPKGIFTQNYLEKTGNSYHPTPAWRNYQFVNLQTNP
ncbi:MAG: hypothetical protein AAF570_19045 [Bacteroidota bacterium]